MGSVPTAHAIRYERSTPIVPPMSMISRVSARNCSRMWRLRAPRATPETNFANTFIHRDQHDVHHADPADPKSQGADEGEKHLKANGQRINHGTKLIPPEHLKSLRIGRREVLPRRHRSQYLRHRLFLEL